MPTKVAKITRHTRKQGNMNGNKQKEQAADSHIDYKTTMIVTSTEVRSELGTIQ